MSLSQIAGYQLTRANILGLANYARDVERIFDLRPVEYTILQLVREGQCTTPSQLAKELSITPPSMSVWLDKLSARKLLARSKSAVDGRASQVQLTPAGARLIEKAHEALLKSEQHFLQPLSAGERVILLEILQKLGKNSHSPL
jgi:DNA-binding MarR family transcriptional regulator